MFKKPVAKEPQTEAEKRQQALVTANVMINDNRAKIRKPMETYQKVAGSTYWSYGYILGSAMGTMALCLAAGNKVPLLRSNASWISLASGYFGGKGLHGVHNSYNVAQVVKTIDDNIAEMKRMDEKHGKTIPDYSREIQQLTKMKHELQPNTEEARLAASDTTVASQMSIDERANALIAAYERKKK